MKKILNTIKVAIIIFIFTIFPNINYADTNVPMELDVTAILTWSNGDLINTVSEEQVEIGLYTDVDTFIWLQTQQLIITDGVINATLSGSGRDSSGNYLILDEMIFEHENLQVGFTLYESGVEKTALVNLSSQPFAIKSARSDYAKYAEDTDSIRGEQISLNAPTAKQVLTYDGSEWIGTNIDETMVDIDSYTLPTNDTQEVTGTLDDLKITGILGKSLFGPSNGAIPTGAILMYSPDVNAPKGAFHPSGGNPNEGEILTWDSANDIWITQENSLENLSGFIGVQSLTPSNSVMIYDSSLGAYKMSGINFSFLSDIDTSQAVDGDILSYDGTNWGSGSFSMSSITNVNLERSDSSSILNGDVLYYNDGDWYARNMKLQDLDDVNTGLGVNKILIGNAYNKYDYISFELNNLIDVVTTNIEVGDVLGWSGSSWTVRSNTIETIDELSDVNISNDPSDSFLYHNGTEWIDQSFDIIRTLSGQYDVSIDSEVDGDVLTYDYTLSKWVNSPGLSELNQTFVNELNTYVDIDTDYDAIELISSSLLLKSYSVNNEFGIGVDNDSIWLGLSSFGANIEQALVVNDEGYVGVGIADPTEALDVSGNTNVSGTLKIGNVDPTDNSDILLQVGGSAEIEGALYISGGSDLAEGFHIIGSTKIEPGTVVSIDTENIGKLRVSDIAYDKRVAGVVSGANGINAGLIMSQTGTLATGEYPIALTGRVWVKCTKENNQIEIGDLLTTSEIAGHAMKATKESIQGSILGKAMSKCTKENLVLTLISLQ